MVRLRHLGSRGGPRIQGRTPRDEESTLALARACAGSRSAVRRGGGAGNQREHAAIRHRDQARGHGRAERRSCRSSARRRPSRSNASRARPRGVSALAADPPLGDDEDDARAGRRLRRHTSITSVHTSGDRRARRDLGPEPRADAQGVSGTSFLPGDCRNNGVGPRSRTRSSTSMVRRVRHEHVPEGVGGVQRAARRATGRDAASSTQPAFGSTPGDGDKIVTLVSNVRDTNFYSLNNPTGARLHRRVLLVAGERLPRSQRHDDRRLRLAPPDGRQPAGRARSRATSARARRRGRSCTRASSRTSTSTCSSTTRTPTRSTGSTRASPTGRRR